MTKYYVQEITEYDSTDWGPYGSIRQAKQEAERMASESHHSTNFYLIEGNRRRDEILVSGKLTTKQMREAMLID
jgi:hypothetical protein